MRRNAAMGRMMITVQRERIHDLWEEIFPLFEAHWREVAHFPDIPLDVNIPRYEQAEDGGMLRCYTARRGSVLIGYAFYFLAHNSHYSGSLQASQDVLFIHPDYRRSGAGLKLMREADRRLRTEGVQAVYHHEKIAHSFAPLLERLGYECIERVWVKRLDKEGR